MNWTEYRHRMLKRVALGDTVESYCANVKQGVWKYRRTDKEMLFSPESRALGELNCAGATIIRLLDRYLAPRPVHITRRGEALLAEWNQKHGEVDS